MRKTIQFMPAGKMFGLAMMALGMLALCLLLGLMAAVVPPGGLVRLLAVPAAVAFLIAIWIMPKQKQAPGTLMNWMLLAVLVTVNLWPAYIVKRIGGLPALSPIKLAWLVLLVGCGYFILASKEPMQRLTTRVKAHPFLIGLVPALLVWRIATAAAGEQPFAQMFTLTSDLISCYILFFIAVAVLRDEKDVRRMLSVLLVVGLLQALLACYESAVKHTLFERFIPMGTEDAALLIDTLKTKFRDGAYRAQGTFEHPMVLAEYMAMMLPLATAVFFATREKLPRWAAVCFMPLAVAVIVYSRSRSGITVLIASVILVGILLVMPRKHAGEHSQKASLVVAMLALLLPVFLLVGYAALQEVMSLVAGRTAGEMNSTMSRVIMMERGVPLVQNSPIMGYGAGMGAIKLGMFDGTRFNIDNWWLGISLDAGLPGLVLSFGFFVLAALLGVMTYYRRDDRAGTVAGMLSISLCMLMITKSVLSIPSGFTLAYVLVAALITLQEQPLGESQSKRHRAASNALAPRPL